MKKFRRSPFSIVCYVLAAVFMAYFIVVVISTVSTINQYYAAYQMSPTFGEVASYLFQSGLSPLAASVVTFMAGLTYDEVRRINPANWAADGEISEADEAKRLAREAKQIAKGEAAKAAAKDKDAAADNGDDDSIKAEFAAVVAEESDDTDVFEDEETVSFNKDYAGADAEADAEAALGGEALDEAEKADEAEEIAEEHTEFSAVVAEDTEDTAEA